MGHRHNRKRTRSRHGNHPAIHPSYNASLHPARLDYDVARYIQSQARRTRPALVYNLQAGLAPVARVWPRHPLASTGDGPQHPAARGYHRAPLDLGSDPPSSNPRYSKTASATGRKQSWIIPRRNSTGFGPQEWDENHRGVIDFDDTPNLERHDSDISLFSSTDRVVKFLFDGHYDFIDAPV